MQRYVIGMAIATAGALTLTACASSTTGHPTNIGGHSVPKFPTTTQQPSGSQPSTSQPSTGGGLTDQQAQAALLTASEVGAGFKAEPANAKSSPLPCDPKAPPLDQQFKPTGKARTDLVSPDGQAYLSEEVIGYDSAATSDKSLAAGEKGLSCRTATLQVNGKPIRYTIAPVQDVTTQVGVSVDKALLWRVQTDTVTIQLIATKIGAQLVVLTFGATARADGSKLPSEDFVVSAALKKVKAHI